MIKDLDLVIETFENIANTLFPGLKHFEDTNFVDEVEYFKESYLSGYNVKTIIDTRKIDIAKDGVVETIYCDDNGYFEYNTSLLNSVISVDILDITYNGFQCKLTVSYSVNSGKYIIYKNHFDGWVTIMSPFINRFCIRPDLILTNQSLIFSGTLEELSMFKLNFSSSTRTLDYCRNLLNNLVDLAKDAVEVFVPEDRFDEGFERFNNDTVDLAKQCEFFKDSRPYDIEFMPLIYNRAFTYDYEEDEFEETLIDTYFNWGRGSSILINEDCTFSDEVLSIFCEEELPNDVCLELDLLRVGIAGKDCGFGISCSLQSGLFVFSSLPETHKMSHIFRLFTDFDYEKKITGTYEELKEWLNKVKHKR